MTLAYFMPKSDNLNILGSHDTQVSEPGPSWPSCLCDGQGAVRPATDMDRSCFPFLRDLLITHT